MTDLSRIDTYRASCPLCGHEFAAQVWRLVDLDARPEQEVYLRDGSFQRSFCPNCVGPGVQRKSAFAIIRRIEDRVEIAKFAPMDTQGPAMVKARFEALDALLAEQLEALGSDPANTSVRGAALFDSYAQMDDRLSEIWEDLPGIRFTSPMLQLAMAIVYARDVDGARTILADNPDLARPGFLSFLAQLPKIADRVSSVLVRPVLTFITQASRIGLEKAAENYRTDGAWVNLVRSLPPEQHDLFTSCLLGERHDADALLALEERLDVAMEEFAGREFAPLRAIIFENIAGGWTTLPGCHPETAFSHAAQFYERLLQEPKDLVPLRSRLDAILGLATLWDSRIGGNIAENARNALNCTLAAKDLMPLLSDEDAARLWMEIGIQYTRALDGDPNLNRDMARAAFANARLPGAASTTRLMITFNLALTYIEVTTGNISAAVKTGLNMLHLIEDQVKDLPPTQQLNYHQSCATAILKLVAHDSGARDRLADASDHLAAAFEIADGLGDGTRAAFIKILVVDAAIQRMVRCGFNADPNQLLAILDEAEQVLTRAEAPALFSHIQTLRAEFHMHRLLGMQDPDAEIACLENAVTALGNDGWHLKRRRLFVRLGELHEDAGRLEEAAKAYGLAVNEAEVMYQSAASSGLRSEEQSKTASLYDSLIRTAAHVADTPNKLIDLVVWMEKARARQFLDSLGSRKLAEPKDVPTDLLAEEVRLRGILSELRDVGPEFGFDSTQNGRSSAERRLEALRALDRVMSDIAQSSAAGQNYADLRRPSPPDRDGLEEIVQSMPDGAVIMAFHVLPEAIVTVMLAQGYCPQLNFAPWTERDTQTVTESFTTDILARKINGRKPAPAQHAWQTLGDNLLNPFADRLATASRVIFVPHDFLHGLPLHSLTLAGKSLIDLCPVQTVPSLGILGTIGRRKYRSSGEKLVMSASRDPEDRPSIDGEARAVADLLSTTHLIDATLKDFYSNAEIAGLIHICCHGKFDAADPMASCLVLNDGNLQANDLLHVALGAELTVLSACETGQMSVGEAEVLDGFARVLLQIGSQRTLLTLWSVFSETTRQWMEDFYRALNEGNDISSSHRIATLNLKEKLPDPIFWAPFVLTGGL